MFECNAFIIDHENEQLGELKPLDQLFINLNYSKDEIYLTPPSSVHDIQQVIDNYTPPRRPNRPYSYYIATNFHPLDLSLVNEKINEIHNETTLVEQDTTTSTKSKKVTRRNKKKHDLSKKSKRLSTSLGNLDENEANLNQSSNTTQNTPLNKKKLKSKDKDFILVDELGNDESNHFLNRRPGMLFQSEKNNTNNKKSNLYASTRRLNKFIRSIFHLDNETSATSTIKETPIENETNKFTSKFSRFFSSFRPTQNHNQINKKKMFDTAPIEAITNSIDLVVTDEQNIQQQDKLMLPEIKLSTPVSLQTDDLNISFKKELNYAEIEQRLKKLTALSYTSGFSSKSDTTGYESASSETLSKKNGKSTSNISTPLSSPVLAMSSSIDSLNQAKSSSCFMDIPFIDEDLESNYDLNIEYDVKTNLVSVSAASSSISSTNELITDQIVKEYLRLYSYDRLDIIVNEYFKCYKSEWLNIVLIFELTNKCIQALNESTDKCEINKLKDLCAKYINDKYCDFIYQNGGWDSIPDSLALIQSDIKTGSNERIH